MNIKGTAFVAGKVSLTENFGEEHRSTGIPLWQNWRARTNISAR